MEILDLEVVDGDRLLKALVSDVLDGALGAVANQMVMPARRELASTQPRPST